MRLRTLGGLELDGAGLSRPKPLLLLAYLTLEGPQERRHLAELFWRSAADPRKSLSVALAQLRSGAPGCVDAGRGRARSAVECDATRMAEAFAAGRREEALRLYRGPFLDGVHVPGLGAELEEWIYDTREALAARVQRQILTLAESEAAADDFEQAARRGEAALRLRGAPPLRQDDLLRLHRILLAGGSPAARATRRDLEDLGAEALPRGPEAARRELRRAMREDDTPPRHNLPARRTSFVGRDNQLEMVAAALRAPQCRLITLLGPAGVGKTRLALEAARRALDDRRYPGGVYFVGLAPVRQAADVAPKVADALGLVGRTTRWPRDELVRHLARRRSLLVLDNFEHLPAAAELVADLLESCPWLSILTTSRIPLRLQGEQELPIGPLPVPAAADSGDDGISTSSPAVRLFLERARAVRPDLPDDRVTLRSVAAICRRLDGIPLGIELAAARVRVFSPAHLAQRLAGSLDLVAGDGPDLPERHRTLRRAIAWGHDLLAPAERRLFRRCSVFPGGFDAETVARFGARLSTRLDRPVDGPEEILRTLESLVANSLVQVETAGEGERFFFLETVRDFARGPLEEAGEAEEARRAHARELLTLVRERVQESEADATGAVRVRWLDRLRAERENLEAAVAWAEARGEAALALGLANAIWRLWLVTDPLDRSADRLEKLLRLAPADGDERERAVALSALGTLRNELSELEPAREALEESLAIFRRRGERGAVATVLANLSWTSLLQGRIREARRSAGEAARLHRRDGDRRGVALALNNLGWIGQLQGRYETAARRHRQSLELRVLAGDQRGEAFARSNLGWAEHHRGRNDEAERLADEALSMLAHFADDQLIAWALYVRSLPAIVRGETDRALDDLRRSVRLWRRVGNPGGLTWALGARGLALAGAGRVAEARDSLRRAFLASRETGSPWALLEVLLRLVPIGSAGGAEGLPRKPLDEAARLADRLGARAPLRAVCRAAGLPEPPSTAPPGPGWA